MTTVSADDRGRIYLPKDVRDDYGHKYRLVKLKEGIKLIPLAENPLEGLRRVVDGKLDDLEISEIDEIVEEEARNEVLNE